MNGTTHRHEKTRKSTQEHKHKVNKETKTERKKIKEEFCLYLLPKVQSYKKI